MKRLFPNPVLSITLLVVWLTLTQSASVGQAILGGAFAILLPRVFAPFLADGPSVRRPLAIARLALRVSRDIVVANVHVARIVLGPESRIDPGFVQFPLSLRSPHGVVVLAGIVSLTPGTVSAEITGDSRFLLVHVLDLKDEQQVIESIRQRYEAPLREIFE